MYVYVCMYIYICIEFFPIKHLLQIESTNSTLCTKAYLENDTHICKANIVCLDISQ